MILSYETGRPPETVQSQRSLLSLHCLPFHPHIKDRFLYGMSALFCFAFWISTVNIVGVQNF